MDIKIVVCYHKLEPLIGNKFIFPILVGAKNSSENIISIFNRKAIRQKLTPLRDDTGDNISELNPNYCELTAIYWMWKNLKADYYGLFHYRRIFDFTNPHHNQQLIQNNTPHQIAFRFIKKITRKLLNQNKILKACQEADIIVPKKLKDHSTTYFSKNANINLYQLYNEAHYKNDMDLCIKYIKDKYPHMQNALENTLYKTPINWHIANMFVMKKELFFEYCEWLFDVLFSIAPNVPIESYNQYQARVFGFLSERLFNVWIEYKKETTPSLRIQEYPLIFLEPKQSFYPLINIRTQTKNKGETKTKRLFICGIRVWKKEIKDN